MNTEVSLGAAITAGWEGLRKHAAASIVGLIIVAAIGFVLNKIPVIGWIGSILVMPVLWAGLYTIFLKANRDENPEIGDVFCRFNDYGKWVIVGLLYVLMGFIAAIPCFIASGIAAARMAVAAKAISTGPTTAALPMGNIMQVAGQSAAMMIPAMLVSWAIAAFLLSRFGFAVFAAADGAAPVDAFAKSSQLTEGKRGQIFLSLIVLGLISAAGALACFVGVLATASIAGIAFAAIYNQIKGAPEAAQPETIPVANPE